MYIRKEIFFWKGEIKLDFFIHSKLTIWKISESLIDLFWERYVWEILLEINIGGSGHISGIKLL